MPFPVILNQPEVIGAMGVKGIGPFATSNCLQWFYYDFAKNVSKEDQKYIGKFSCDPDEEGSGILKNMISDECFMDLETPVSCPNVELNDAKRVPYFNRPEKVCILFI